MGKKIIDSDGFLKSCNVTELYSNWRETLTKINSNQLSFVRYVFVSTFDVFGYDQNDRERDQKEP